MTLKEIFEGTNKEVSSANEMIDARALVTVSPIKRTPQEDPQVANSQEVDVTDLYSLIDYLDPADYDIVADLILDFLDEEYEDEIHETDDEDEDELDEGARFTGKKKGKRRFDTTKSKMRQNRKKNKTANRKNRVKNRTKLKKTKNKRKKYAKSRNDAIKRGQHVAKQHRGR